MPLRLHRMVIGYCYRTYGKDLLKLPVNRYHHKNKVREGEMTEGRK